MKKAADTHPPMPIGILKNKLHLAQKRLLSYTENTSMGFIEWDDRLKVKTWSKQAEAIFGWSRREIKSRNKDGYSQVYTDDVPMVNTAAHELLTGAIKTNRLQHRNYTKNGRVIWCEWFNSVLEDPKGKVTGILSQVQDITEQKAAAEKIIVTSHLYALISQVNQTITHSKDQQTVLREACHIACEFGKFKVAWVIEKDETRYNKCPAYECGLPGGAISLVSERNNLVEQETGAGNIYIADDLVNDAGLSHLWTLAARCGWRSCAALPLKKSGQVVAVFYLVSDEPHFFTLEVVARLKEMSGDISFALNMFEEEKDRKRMTEETLHSAMRMRQAQAIAHIGSWELNIATGVLVWSAEACRIYGLLPEDNIQSYQLWLSYIHPEDFDHVLNVIKTGEETLSPVAFYHRIIRRDGTVRYIFSQAEFELDEEGKRTVLYGIAHDITEIKAGEKALSQSETNLSQIVDLLPQSVFVRNAGGKYLFVNKSFAAWNGLSPQELIGQSLRKTIPARSDVAYFLKQDQAVISSGEMQVEPEYAFTDHLGNLYSLRIEKVPFTIAGSGERGVLGIMTDITEQKRVDLERTKMTADLVQRNTDLEQFSYIISHNLRSSVANILGLTGLLQRAGLETPEAKELVGRLSFTVKKLDGVIMDINHILEINHKENKQKEWVKFSELLQDIRFSMAGQIKADNVEIISDFSAADEMLTLKSYLYSIFFNLVSNSIKYRRPGIRPVIHINSEKLGDQLRFVFKDNGMGIDLDKHSDQLFGLYKRFHNHVDGKGMGLHLVKTQVESLGGKISVSSTVNRGTEFRVEFQGIDRL